MFRKGDYFFHLLSSAAYIWHFGTRKKIHQMLQKSVYLANGENLPIILLSTTYITATFRIKNVHSEIAF